MKVRFLGQSFVEVIGRRHILIDPEFTIDPEPGIEYICITHGQKDHIRRLVEIRTEVVVASPSVSQTDAQMGVSRHHLRPVQPGEQIANIFTLPGYSQTKGLVNTF